MKFFVAYLDDRLTLNVRRHTCFATSPRQYCESLVTDQHSESSLKRMDKIPESNNTNVVTNPERTRQVHDTWSVSLPLRTALTSHGHTHQTFLKVHTSSPKAVPPFVPGIPITGKRQRCQPSLDPFTCVRNHNPHFPLERAVPVGGGSTSGRTTPAAPVDAPSTKLAPLIGDPHTLFRGLG